jgi:hypothetical protein
MQIVVGFFRLPPFIISMTMWFGRTSITVSLLFSKAFIDDGDRHLFLQIWILFFGEIKVSEYDIRHFLLALIFVNKQDTASSKLNHLNPEDLVDMGAMIMRFDVIIDYVFVKTHYFIIILYHLELPDDQAIIPRVVLADDV